MQVAGGFFGEKFFEDDNVSPKVGNSGGGGGQFPFFNVYLAGAPFQNLVEAKMKGFHGARRTRLGDQTCQTFHLRHGVGERRDLAGALAKEVDDVGPRFDGGIDAWI